MADSKLTPEQIETWRKALILTIGPEAKIIPADVIQNFHDKLRADFEEAEKEVAEITRKKFAGLKIMQSRFEEGNYDISGIDEEIAENDDKNKIVTGCTHAWAVANHEWSEAFDLTILICTKCGHILTESETAKRMTMLENSLANEQLQCETLKVKNQAVNEEMSNLKLSAELHFARMRDQITDLKKLVNHLGEDAHVEKVT